MNEIERIIESIQLYRGEGDTDGSGENMITMTFINKETKQRLAEAIEQYVIEKLAKQKIEHNREIVNVAEGMVESHNQDVIKARVEILIDLVPNHLIIEKCLWVGSGENYSSHRNIRIEINHIDNDLDKPLNYEEAFKKAIIELKKGLK